LIVAGQRSGVEPGTLHAVRTPASGSCVSGLLCIGAVLTLVVRPVTWVLTFGFIGPLFGFFDYMAWDASRGTGQRPVIIVEWAAPAVAVVVALKVAQLLRQGSARAARIVPALGLIFLVATAIYLVSLVVLAMVLVADIGTIDGLTGLAVTAVVAAVHLYLLRLSLRIWRSRPILARAAEQSGGHPDPADRAPR
jgi:hypothetical protein